MSNCKDLKIFVSRLNDSQNVLVHVTIPCRLDFAYEVYGNFGTTYKEVIQRIKLYPGMTSVDEHNRHLSSFSYLIDEDENSFVKVTVFDNEGGSFVYYKYVVNEDEFSLQSEENHSSWTHSKFSSESSESNEEDEDVVYKIEENRDDLLQDISQIILKGKQFS